MIVDKRITTTIKFEPRLYDKFKLLSIKHKLKLQGLTERAMYLYVNLPAFRKVINQFAIPKSKTNTPLVTDQPVPDINQLIDEIPRVIEDASTPEVDAPHYDISSVIEETVSSEVTPLAEISPVIADIIASDTPPMLPPIDESPIIVDVNNVQLADVAPTPIDSPLIVVVESIETPSIAVVDDAPPITGILSATPETLPIPIDNPIVIAT